MSNHNICFRGEIRKIFTRYSLLSSPMGATFYHLSSFRSHYPSDTSLILSLKCVISKSKNIGEHKVE